MYEYIWVDRCNSIWVEIPDCNKEEIMKHEGVENTMSDTSIPVLPVTANGYGYGGYHDKGFQPSDAALVQSNNLSILQNQFATLQAFMADSVNRNSKENALLSKDVQISNESLRSELRSLQVGLTAQLATISAETKLGLASVESKSDISNLQNEIRDLRRIIFDLRHPTTP